MENLEDFEKYFVSYIEASQVARSILSELHGLELTSLDIQTALAEKLNVSGNPPRELLGKNLTTSQIVTHLRDFDFRKYHPEILLEVTFDEPLLSPDHPLLLTEKTVKVKGEKWQIHKNDADPFPSIPHAHNYAAGVVLDLGTGEMFSTRDRNSVGNIGCKKLLRLRGELIALTLPSTGCV